MQQAAEQRLRRAESDLADRDASMAPGRAQVWPGSQLAVAGWLAALEFSSFVC